MVEARSPPRPLVPRVRPSRKREGKVFWSLCLFVVFVLSAIRNNRVSVLTGALPGHSLLVPALPQAGR